MKITSFVVFICFAHSAFAIDAPSAKLLIIRGDVKFNGAGLTQGSVLSKSGLVKTGANGQARIEVLPTHTILEVSPSSEVQINLPDSQGIQQVALNQGVLRAHVMKHPELKVQRFFIKTKTATLGVRGTDFFGTSNPLLGESEIVVFEGFVDFASTSNPKDRKLVKAGQWGGIGGRFGSKTHDLMNLPENVLRTFDQTTAVK